MLRGNAGQVVRGADFNVSPPEVAYGLLGVEHWRLTDFDTVWEPACGDGAIVRPLRAAGHRVFASDLHDRGFSGQAVMDFLAGPPRMEPRAIVTNPPFSLAQDFAEHALACSTYVALLLRLQFLEGQKRSRWLATTPLSRICIYGGRLPMMHREGYEGRKLDKGALCFAWFIWDRVRGPARQVSWITSDDVDAGRQMAGGVS